MPQEPAEPPAGVGSTAAEPETVAIPAPNPVEGELDTGSSEPGSVGVGGGDASELAAGGNQGLEAGVVESDDRTAGVGDGEEAESGAQVDLSAVEPGDTPEPGGHISEAGEELDGALQQVPPVTEPPVEAAADAPEAGIVEVDAVFVDLPGGATMEMVQVAPGSFTMGSPESEPGRSADEGPQHLVEISEGFHLGRFEVTRNQWGSVMGLPGGSGGSAGGGEYPAVSVSWDEVEEFVSRVNDFHGVDRFHLPTEAEWEYAARGGTQTRYSFGDVASALG